jgi:hypothetical protein
MGFVGSLEGHATIFSQSFSFLFQNALPIETNILRFGTTLGDTIGSIAFGELRFALLQKGSMAP